VVGEAGMGKSRLIEEFTTWLELLPDPVVYVRGRASQGTSQDAFGLWRDTLALRFGVLDTDSPATVGQKLAAGLGDQGSAPAEPGIGADRWALIGYLLGFDLGGGSLFADLEPQARHDLAIEAFEEWLGDLAAEAPVVVVLEDLHWSDDPSLDLASRLVNAPGSRRVLVVGSARPALFDRRPDWQAGEGRPQRIDLRPLGNRDTRKLIAEILVKVHELPEGLRETVVTAAEGNPFHVEELLKMLIEDGTIVKGDVAWEVARDRLPTIRVPATLVGVLQARIDALGAEEKSVLHRAAVIGRSFWDSAVAALDDQTDALRRVLATIKRLATKNM
jgi:predicted ATPase